MGKCLCGRIRSICILKLISCRDGPKLYSKYGGLMILPALMIYLRMESLIYLNSLDLRKFSVKCGLLLEIGNLERYLFIWTLRQDLTILTFFLKIFKKGRKYSVNLLAKYLLKLKPSEKTLLHFKYLND
jgi:hypothetical protein